MMSKVGKKMIVNTEDELNMLKGIMKRDAFFAKFELSTGLVAKMTAKDALVYNAFTDMEMTSAQKKMLLNGEF